jgi:hypothetical protein
MGNHRSGAIGQRMRRSQSRLKRRQPGGRRLLLFLVVVAVDFCGTRPRCHGADFVVHISVDGLRPDFLQTLVDAGQAPNFKRFQTEGAWTNNARTDYTHTNTLPNHTSMLTGRPVLQPAGMPNTAHHGYTDNGEPSSSSTIHNLGNPNVPYKASTFDVAHDAGLSTALFATKTKFVIYEQSYNENAGAAHPNGKDKIDTSFIGGPAATQNQLLAELGTKHFGYTFVHYANADNAGHSSGWGSTAYNNALVTVDGYLGGLFNLVTTDATLAGRTAIILSADHGGSGGGHGDVSSALHYTIPFYVWGAGVAHGNLYEFNPDTRADPGTARPMYTASGQPIRNGDGGNLALDLLGLGAIPGSLINAGQNLSVTMQGIRGDFNRDNVVDMADYQILLDNMGLHLNGPIPSRSGDLNFDGKINTLDFGIFKTEFPGGAGAFERALAGAYVPEPSTVALALLAMCGFTFERRGAGAKAA